MAKIIKQGYGVKVLDPDEARKLPNFLNCPHGREVDDPEEVARQIVAAHR